MRLVGGEGILFPCAVVVSLYGWLGSNVMAVDLYRQRPAPYSWYGACTEERWKTCLENGESCRESTGECVCEWPRRMIAGTCVERACTEERIERCMKIGASCQEPTGKCYCEDGQQIIEGICQEEPRCTKQKAEECVEKMATCEESTGKCVCDEGKEMIDYICREPACPKQMKDKCAERGATCEKSMCVCIGEQQMIDGVCKEPHCTIQVKEICAGRGATCEEFTGKCVCEEGKEMIDDRCRETTSAGTEPSKWQSGHTTEPTTVRAVTSGSSSEVPTCTEEMREKCAQTGHTCEEYTGTCVCEVPKKLFGDQCKDNPT